MDQPGYTKEEAQRGLGLQCLIAFSIGSSALISFSFWRRRWPQIYAARTLKKPELPPLSKSLFGWVSDTIKISDREVLRFAGLDAYVYLMFFRAAITVLWKLSLVSLFFIAPLRWYYPGSPADDEQSLAGGAISVSRKRENFFGDYIWVYVASTYIFTIICLRTMQHYTNEVIMIRQAYLGHQSSITDRTLRISGIPRKLRSEATLRQYFKTLFGTEPESIVLCRNWKRLDSLFSKRKRILRSLEELWATYIGPDNPVLSEVSSDLLPATTPPSTRYQDTPSPIPDASRSDTDLDDSQRASSAESSLDRPNAWTTTEEGGIKAISARLFPNKKRPEGRVHHLGITGPKVDLIDYFTEKLDAIDESILEERAQADSRPVTEKAFVTMKTAAHCQLAAQAIFSPRSHIMVNYLAPSPKEILWENIYMKPKQRATKNYIISIVVLLATSFFAYFLSFLARFLDIDTIRRHFPTFGNWLSERKWMASFVTDVLPTFVFSSFNLVMPYFFAWLSRCQGFISKGDVELSTVGKNFFFIFINLFLIFTIESTFLSFSVDKVAKDFAQWLIRLSSFYTNLIVLQGIGITPLKLLQPGALFNFQVMAPQCKTARDFHDLYRPQKINYGLVLPTPMFIFIVALAYSILERRILLFGLIYFAASYFVFKYQLLYSMVHPQHSNARLWTIVLRRVYLGICVFHLAMIGVLVLQSEYRFALLILPLSVLLLGFWYDYERFANPLLEFVAVESLKQQEMDLNELGTYQPEAASSSDRSDELPTFTDALLGPDEDDDPGQAPPPQSPGQPQQRRVRERASALFGRVEALVSMDLSGQNNSELTNEVWETNGRHEQTIDEYREESLEYVNKNLVSPLEGPWVATNAFEYVVANPSGFERRRNSYGDWV